MDDFAKVPALTWTFAGPTRVLFQTKASSKSYAELAKSELFAMKKLMPGLKAPDIEGVDADGKTFRLSEYHGKILLLTFSANWCGGCVELYPLQRELVQEFCDAPFALLSVSCDKNVDTLKQSTASAKITWRCWWDGTSGPIRNAWNLPGLPTIFLLDENHIIQDAGLTKLSSKDDFVSAISKLLKQTVPNEAGKGSE